MIKIDILSDPICPWCYIGKANLERALAERPENPFVIEWHPFQLNPEMPPEGMDRRDYLEAIFGNRDAAVQAHMDLAQHAHDAGVPINFAAITRTPNTLNAHRLIHWAGLENRQTAVVTALFDAYFQQGRDIGDAAVLKDIASSTGMDGDVVARLLAGDADAEDIKARDAHARARGVTGVPTFIVAERHAVVGAQPPVTWVKVIDEIAELAAVEPRGTA